MRRIEWNVLTGKPADVLQDILSSVRTKQDIKRWGKLGSIVEPRQVMPLVYRIGVTSCPFMIQNNLGSDFPLLEVVYSTANPSNALEVERAIFEDLFSTGHNYEVSRSSSEDLNFEIFVYVGYRVDLAPLLAEFITEEWSL